VEGESPDWTVISVDCEHPLDIGFAVIEVWGYNTDLRIIGKQTDLLILKYKHTH